MKGNRTIFGKDKYLALSKIGTSLNLNFSSFIEACDKLVALDGQKKILIAWDIRDDIAEPLLIRLSEVKAISLRLIYRSIRPGELHSRKVADFLQSIHLLFAFRHPQDNLVLPLFEYGASEVQDVSKLEKSARNWRQLLSKLTALPSPPGARIIS